MFIFIAWISQVTKQALDGEHSSDTRHGTVRLWGVQATQVYSVFSIVSYAILPSFFEDSLVKIVAPQLVGALEWALLAIIIAITRKQIDRIIKNLESGGSTTKYTILSRMHKLLGYSMMFLILQAFGMGMMDWDIVKWHPSFTGNEISGTKFVYDTIHPLRTDLMTAIYSTGFALIPLPVVIRVC